MQPSSERRSAPRRTVNFKVQHWDPRTQKSAFDFARDLSSAGLFLRTQRVRALGATLELAFPVDDLVNRMKPLRLRGKVTRLCPDGLGVHFLPLEDPECAQALKTLLGG